MVGQTIKDLLTQRQMTMAELARACDTPTTTLYSIIARDNNTIDLELLARISGTMDVPLEYFFQGLRYADNDAVQHHRAGQQHHRSGIAGEDQRDAGRAAGAFF